MDDLVVSPGLVSAPLDLQPGLSGFGALLQLARLNHFHGSDFLAAFGLRFQYRDDLSQLLAFSAKRQALVAAAARLPLATLEAWSVAPWQPFASTDVWANLPWTLRGCPLCLRAGYHSNLFQMPWMARCPWHRVELVERCRRCQRPLLDGFRARKSLLVCECGHDAVDETAILRGDTRIRSERREFITQYRRWTETSLSTHTLIGPEEADPHGRLALASVVQPPPTLARWANAFAPVASGRVHRVERVRRERRDPLGAHEHAQMVRAVNDIWPGDPGLADLPEALYAPLLQITHDIAHTAPGDAFTARERDRLALPPATTPAPTTASRYELLSLPIQRAGEHAYLDLRVLHRTTARTASHLAWQLLSTDPSRRFAASGSHELIYGALRHTLARGYADGLVHVLGRHVPALFDAPRIRSGPRLPWVLLEKDREGIRRITQAWSPRRPWNDLPASSSKRSTK
jgi:hypothetical protein